MTPTMLMTHNNCVKAAFASAGLGQGLECVKEYSEESCIKLLNETKADLTMLAAHRADEAIHAKKVIPLLEQTQFEDSSVYAVAVTLTSTGVNGLNDIKDRDDMSVCSSGVDSFAGWEAPNHAFKSLGFIAKDNCFLTEKWAELFRHGCVPGAQDTRVTLGRNASYPINKEKAAKLCSICSQGDSGWCRTPAQAKDEDHFDFDIYYGDIGALRCLLRNKGNIAFIRNIALNAIDELKTRKDQDVRNIDHSRFRLLCSDGKTNMEYTSENVKKCNLGKMPDRWMVARGSASKDQMRFWQNKWISADNRARGSYDWFRTYIDFTPRKTYHLLDLIFSNSTERLRRLSLASDAHDELHDILYSKWDDPFACGCFEAKSSATIVIGFLFIVLAFVLL